MFSKNAWTLVLFVLIISGCSFPHSGPSFSSVEDLGNSDNQYPIAVIKINNEVNQTIKKHEEQLSFRKVFGNVKPDVYKVKSGDSIELFIWESSPSLLFGSNSYDAEDNSVKNTALPIQLVEEDGNIKVPFVGEIKVAGKTVRQIEKDLCNSLKDKANNPQVIVNVSKRPSSQVTVIGDVNNSSTISLTPKGERILDALAQSSGVTQSYNKIMLSLTRGLKTSSLPLETVIENPEENIYLNPNDVLVATYQPWSFTALGPAGKNQEVKLEATGLTVIEALARIGGLNDYVANPDGVFIFRFEDKNIYKDFASKLNSSLVDSSSEENVDKIPVVYQLFMSEPRSLFDAQNFKIKNRDIVYLASSDVNELSKFLKMIGLVVNPLMSWGNTANNIAN